MSSILLSNRLAVIGQKNLKLSFSSALIFALKGVQDFPEERLKCLIFAIEDWVEKDSYLRVREFCMKDVNFSIWQQCLSDGVYSYCLYETISEKMAKILENKNVVLEDVWNMYLSIYARELLHLGAKTINDEKNEFNLNTVRYFICHPDKVHGEELVNDIPPILENGYIYLNNCGENQKTTWHRDLFLDSYFLALMSYLNVISISEIARAFRLKKVTFDKTVQSN